MPGILPMKVIKVGNSAQSRIAQACDRCRSKKIRCDGIRPTCSQCANVGFECRTSDKLSRRAFPRGYTESLEERVRVLEAEVRELKDLLDEKDEKIDMLSAMHNSRRRPSVTTTTVAPTPESTRESPKPKEDTFKVQASPLLLGVENSDAYFMGSSSGRAFIAAFKRKIQETGKPCAEFNPEAFLHMQGCPPLTARLPEASVRVPPRMFSDRCVNVYFQEWAPLFPVLHKPTFLRLYEEFVADPEKVRNKHKLAQLYLVFSLAGLSSSSPDLNQLASCERQWTEALDQLLLENTMSTLQCLLLALLYFSLTADYRRLQHYKSIAVGLSQRLGLHQSQKRFSFGALTLETRKKVFWTLYTIDCFSAATLGLPRLFKEEDVQAELPSDTDDEYITEKGFQPTLPGEHTRLSSALALFGAARVLAAVLDKNYPAATSYDLSLSQLRALDADLDAWYENLPGHLKLNFKQDKPSTDVTGSRSPLLALAYFNIRTLIHRPAIGSGLGAAKGASNLLALADSSKRIIQITDLLQERNLSFSFCLNRGDMLALCAMTLLYRVVDLKPSSKLLRDDERLVNGVIKSLDATKAAGYIDLRKIASMLISVDGSPCPSTSPSGQRKCSASSPSSKSPASHSRKKNSASPASDTQSPRSKERSRRMTMPEVLPSEQLFDDSQGRHSFDSVASDPTLTATDTMAMPQMANGQLHPAMMAVRPNLDYLSLGNTPSGSRPASPGRSRQHSVPTLVTQAGNVVSNAMAAKMAGVSPSEWEALLGSMDGGMNNVYHTIYGGSTVTSEPPMSVKNEWSPNSWDLRTFNIGELGGNGEGPQSVLSLSDESLSSGEEVAPSELGLSVGSVDYGRETFSFPADSLDGFLL